MFGASLVVVGGLMAGCGGGSSKPKAETTGTTAGGSTATADPSAVAGALALSSSDCRAAIQAFAAGPAAAFSGGGGNLSQLADNLKKVQNAAPSEIKDDWAYVVEYYVKIANAAKDAGIDFTKPETFTPDKIQKLSAASEGIDQARIQTASEKISKYFADHCKT